MDEQALRAALEAGVQASVQASVQAGAQAVLQAVSSRREEGERECKRMRTEATAEADGIRRGAREERAALEEEKASMEKAMTFQKNQITLNVGGRALSHSPTFQLLNMNPHPIYPSCLG